MAQVPLIPSVAIPQELDLTLRRMNPWWAGDPGKVLPPHRRHLVGQMRRRLDSGLAPIVVVRGSRQIGKTTSQLQLIAELLSEGLPPTHVFHVQFDELASLKALGPDPVLRLVDWYERAVLGKTLNAAAHEGWPTLLAFDEVQNLTLWAQQLKALVDATTTRVVVTGSSALRIGRGQDSLAGRISTIEAGTLSLTEIATLRGIPLGAPFLVDNGLGPLVSLDFWRALAEHGRGRAPARDAAFVHFSQRGGYPLGHERAQVPWEQLADQLNENVIRKVIRHDLRVGERGRKRDPQLLEEVFRVACRYAGQDTPFRELAEQIRLSTGANVGDQRVRQYVRFLADALLLRAIEPLEIRLKKRRAGPKLCLVDHALRASWLQEVVPLTSEDLSREGDDLGTLAGRIAESTVGAVLSTIGNLDIAHQPRTNQQPEVDFVLTVGTKRVPIEVKYQARVDPVRDVRGLRTFLDNAANHAPFGVLVTRDEPVVQLPEDIVGLPLASLMLLR